MLVLIGLDNILSAGEFMKRVMSLVLNIYVLILARLLFILLIELIQSGIWVSIVLMEEILKYYARNSDKV